MRYIHPIPRSERIVKRFALFPIRIGYESRWMEWVSFVQIYRPELRFFGKIHDKFGWVNDRFT